MDVKRVLIDEQTKSLMLAAANSSNLSYVKSVHKKPSDICQIRSYPLKILHIISINCYIECYYQYTN